MTTHEIASRLVELCRQGKIAEAQEELYSDSIISLEPMGAPMQNVEGKANVIAKGHHFQSMIEEFHGSTISEPVVADDHFSLSWMMDCTLKGMGRQAMNEICVYKVEDGKIASEQFFYTAKPMA